MRLASRVFAPHYAAAMPCVAVRPVPVHEQPHGGEIVTQLAVGDRFDVLELAGDHAWGIARMEGATAIGLVGYCDRDALELA